MPINEGSKSSENIQEHGEPRSLPDIRLGPIGRLSTTQSAHEGAFDLTSSRCQGYVTEFPSFVRARRHWSLPYIQVVPCCRKAKALECTLLCVQYWDPYFVRAGEYLWAYWRFLFSFSRTFSTSFNISMRVQNVDVHGYRIETRDRFHVEEFRISHKLGEG